MTSFDPVIGAKVRLSNRIERAIAELADGEGALIMHAETDWASITFAGARHQLTWTFDGAAAVAAGEAMLLALPDHEFALPGQLVADAEATHVERRADPPALVVDLQLLILEAA